MSDQETKKCREQFFDTYVALCLRLYRYFLCGLYTPSIFQKIYTVRCITIKNRTENHSSKTGFCIEMHHEVGPKDSFVGAQQLLRECATFRFDILCRSASGEVGESGTMSINDARLLMADFQKRLSEVTTFLGVAEIVDLVVDWSASGPQKTRS